MKECVAKALEYQFLTAPAKNPHPRVRINAKWTKPDLGWLKLNTNASIINGRADVGGLIRDSNGNWVQGFSKSIGTSSVLMAELWALRDGIRMAKNLNIQSLLINMDCSEVVNLITSHSSINRLTQPLVDECRDILQAFHQARLHHCYRESKAADSLAKIGSLQQEAFVYYVSPPLSILDVLAFDSAVGSAPNVIPVIDSHSLSR